MTIEELKAENARLKADVNELADGLKLASEVGIKMADEVTRLKAEVERLTAFTTRTIIPNEELQAQVERLTKELENTDCMFAMASAFARDWNAAKEGKGQP
jgi:predicted RNase H-like nuclease (RuvC/YqgF family)